MQIEFQHAEDVIWNPDLDVLRKQFTGPDELLFNRFFPAGGSLHLWDETKEDVTVSLIIGFDRIKRFCLLYETENPNQYFVTFDGKEVSSNFVEASFYMFFPENCFVLDEVAIKIAEHFVQTSGKRFEGCEWIDVNELPPPPDHLL